MPTARRPRSRAGTGDAEASIRVLRQFRLVFNAVKSHFRAMEREAGLAGAQVWALSVVRDRPGIAVAALAQQMDIHQSTASNLLKPLLEKGLVAANRSEADRRVLELHISVKGLAALKKVPGPFQGVLPDVLRRLDPALLDRLERDLGELIALLPPGRREPRKPLGQPDA